MNWPNREGASRWWTLPWLLFAVVTIILDQASKTWMLALLSDGPIRLLSWFELRLAYNTGAAFSFLATAGGWQQFFFIGLSLIVSLVLLFLLYRSNPQERYKLAAISLILGGAIGNLLDRLRLNHVIDFIHLHYHQYSWPIFNIADTALCFGVSLWIIISWRES